jgi:hypothetical protein
MTRRLVVGFVALAALAYLPACNSGGQGTGPSSGRIISAQQESAAQSSRISTTERRAEQRVESDIDARTRAQLKPGTRVYYIPMITVVDGGNGSQFPANSTVSRTQNSIVVTPPDQPAKVFRSSAQIIYVPRGGQVFVPPGTKVPAFLHGRVPSEVIH